MTKRVPGSERTREALNELMEGRMRVENAKSDLVKLATRLIIEEGLEAEVRDSLGRDYYEHGGEPGRGHRNGSRPGRLKTAEGFIDYRAPQVAGTAAPFRSELRAHLKGHSEVLEDLSAELLARGLSVRDIEDAFKDEEGRLLLSRTAVSEMGERLWQDHLDFSTRDLSEYEVIYLICRRHCRAPASGAEARAGAGGLGLLRQRGEGPAGDDGRLQGGQRDRFGVLSGHSLTRPGRSLVAGLRRGAWHHQGDRALLPALCQTALPGAPHEKSVGKGV